LKSQVVFIGVGNTSVTGGRQRCRTLQLNNKLCRQQLYLLISYIVSTITISSVRHLEYSHNWGVTGVGNTSVTGGRQRCRTLQL